MHPTRSFATAVPTLMRVTLTVLALGAASARAQEKGVVPSDATAIPMPPPTPPARPAGLSPVPDARSPADAPANPAAEVPRPPERPPELSVAKPPEAAQRSTEAASEPGAPPVPPPRPAELAGATPLAVTVSAPDDTACRRRLERLGAVFEALPAIADGQCGAARPLKVSSLSGDLALTPPATLVCDAAEALARWATEVQVAAERDLGHPLKGLSVGTSYECRGQNHDPQAKLSEHSFANGIDVMGFGFTGRTAIAVGVLSEASPEATFLSGVRSRACGFFRTVLGPGSDAAHANHFHLDERERSAGHRLCQ